VLNLFGLLLCRFSDGKGFWSLTSHATAVSDDFLNLK